jgi:hypothetical protein
VASFEERIYQLGSDALAQQERQVANAKGRASLLLATGAVVPSLLAKAVFHGNHPVGVAEVTATTLGLVGAGGVLVFAGLLLFAYESGFSLDAEATWRELRRANYVVQPTVDLALAKTFEAQRRRNAPTVRRLVRFLGLALASLVLETAGLAVAAALAS